MGSGAAAKGSPGAAVLTHKAVKARMSRMAAPQSALVRQKGLADKRLLAAAGGAKKAKGAVKGAAGKELAQAKKLKTAAVPVRKLGTKEAAGLKKATQLKSQAARKAMTPARSALLRQKSLLGKEAKAAQGNVKKARGVVKGAAGKELAQAKKAAVPVRNVATKDVGGLKKAAGLKKKAALKAMTPAHSALLRQKKLAGHDLSAAKSRIGRDMSGIKKAGQQSKAAMAARSSMKSVGAATKRARPNLTRPPKLGRLLWRGGPR
jgi:hypothetical protein